MGKEMKLSFSLPSKPSSSRPNPNKRPPSHDNGGGGGALEDGEAKPQFVTHFDPSETLASNNPAKLVIPPIPNADFRGTKEMKNILPPPPDDAPSESRFVLDSSSTTNPSNLSYGLTLRSTLAGDGGDSQPQKDEGDLMLQRFRDDMKTLPEDRGLEEFADVPIEGFGAAILAGYGWSEGKGIGRNNKGDVPVVQYDRRAGTEGLGFVPSATDPKNSRRKGSVVGHKEEKAEPVVVRVISGRHEGLKGQVLMKSGSSGVVLKLLSSGEEVTVEEDMVAELGSTAEEKCLKRLKELRIHGRDERREERREEKRGRKSRRVEKVQEGKNSHQMSSGRRERSPVRWLRSHIRVRIISKDFRKGKLYLKKGEVVDVVGPTTCNISMDESRELVEGVDQEILETALPKCGGPVLVLYGKHKGVYGSLVERNMEEETGVVRDADDHALINVRLEQVAEYVGDSSYLGY